MVAEAVPQSQLRVANDCASLNIQVLRVREVARHVPLGTGLNIPLTVPGVGKPLGKEQCTKLSIKSVTWRVCLVLEDMKSLVVNAVTRE